MDIFDAEKLDYLGVCLLPELIGPAWIEATNRVLEHSFDKHRKIQIGNSNDIVTDGVALHVLLDDPIFFTNLLEHLLIDLKLKSFLETHYFKSPFILNSMSGLNNLPNQLNFSAVIHRDLRFYTGEIPIMLNALIMLDDFTEENGPTLLLQCSHHYQHKPSPEWFYQHAIKAIGKAGSVLLFNANVWHSSSLNTSNKGRRALPITFTKSLIKQLLDYPRALGYDNKDRFSKSMQQILGYDSRVPANLDEWYQPFDKRFYKKNQD